MMVMRVLGAKGVLRERKGGAIVDEFIEEGTEGMPVLVELI